MERLEKESPTQELSDELKAKLAELSKAFRSEEHTSELQPRRNLVCRLPLEKKKKIQFITHSSSVISS